MVILEDANEIKSIHTSQEGIFVNGVDITSIIPYTESGEMAVVIWFAIYCDEKIVRRVNGSFVESVVYK